MSMIGKKVGEFKATAYLNGEFVPVSNESIKGKWSVFFFYPADFTFVCPTELGDLADNYAEFTKIGCEIYSVSTDTHFTHKAWHDTSDTIKKIKYPMLADPTHKISQDFEVLIPEEGLALRGTFIVNPNGEIVSYEVNANNIGRDSAELLRKVQAAQFVAKNGDQVCPAKWKPGAETLKPSLDLIGKL
ncbi:MAG: alkyl hydroperoxide reductase subunit C [Erysipelotrichales bacterium]|nr:alkyl hydroperoxide reductase subunit C [Erysipelotrichales bacterium]